MLGPEVEFVDRDYLLAGGKKLLYLAGTDYHRLSCHPVTKRTMARAAESLGVSPAGSRVTTGNHEVYMQLEKNIAGFFDTEDAMVLPGGYLSNLILLQTVGDKFDCLFIDEKSHPSIVDAAYMVAGRDGKKMVRFRHLSADSLEEEVRRHLRKGSKPLVMTDGVFPVDGSMPPLKDYVGIVREYEGKILLDDAHAMAVTGREGKGSWEEAGTGREWVYQTGTLSKGFGTYGGVITGSEKLMREIRNRSDAFAGCTGLPLPVAAAGIFTVSHLTSNRWMIGKLQEKAINLKSRFKDIGLKMPETPVPVFPIVFDDTRKDERLKNKLFENGIYPSFIKYPGAPSGGLFRFIITSSTTEDQIVLLFETIKSTLEENEMDS